MKLYNDNPVSFTRGSEFPFNRRRMCKYRENIKLFEGDHFDVFNKWNTSRSLYVYTNLAGLICKKSADFLFGEEALITAGTGDSTPEATAVERLVTDNYLGQQNYEAALSAAVLGDAFYRIIFVFFENEEAQIIIGITKTKQVINKPKNADVVCVNTSGIKPSNAIIP